MLIKIESVLKLNKNEVEQRQKTFFFFLDTNLKLNVDKTFRHLRNPLKANCTLNLRPVQGL